MKDLGGQYEGSRAGGFGMEAKRRIMLGSYLLSAGVYEKYYYPAQQVPVSLITQDYERAYDSATSSLFLRARAPRSSSAKSAILWKCICPISSRCRSISPATAA